MLPPEVIADAALKAVLPAAGAAGALFYALLRWRGPALAGPAAAAALAAGLLLGNRIRGAIELSDDSADLHRLVNVTLAVLFLGCLARWRQLPDVVATVLRLAGAVLAARVITGLAPEEPPLPTWQVAALLFAGWVVCERASRPPGGAGALALALAAFAAGLVLLHAHTARMADAAVLLGAALGGVGLVGWCQGSDAGGAVPGGVVMLAGLLLVGQDTTYSEVPPRCFLLAGAAPLALAPTLLPWPRRLAGWRLGLLRLALVAAPLAVAVRWAMRAESLEW